MFKHIFIIIFDHQFKNTQKNQYGNINFMGIGPHALRSTI